jgi:5-methylthioadenosine/S-adenosylhomocysteine deaminase
VKDRYYKNAWLFCSELGLRRGDLYIKDGLIADPESAPAKDLKIKKADDLFITPAFINAHTHAAMNFLKGACHGQSNMIEDVFFKKESTLSGEDVYEYSKAFLKESFENGVTTIAEHYYHAKSVAKAASELGIKCIYGETIADLGGAQPKSDFESYIDPQDPMQILCPHAADTVSLDLMSKIANYSRSHGLIPVHMHLSQTQKEFDTCMKAYGKSPTRLVLDAGLAHEHALFVHLVSATSEDFKALYDQGSYTVICPSSEILYEKLPDMTLLNPEQTIVATDCAASCDHADVLSELRFFALLYKNYTGVSLDPKVLFAMISSNPARALKLNAGDLIIGREASLCLFEVNDQCWPQENLAYHLIYANLKPKKVIAFASH